MDGQMSMDFAWTPLHETKGFAEGIRRDEYGVDLVSIKMCSDPLVSHLGWGQLYV
jgi:hypothetical protein